MKKIPFLIVGLCLLFFLGISNARAQDEGKKYYDKAESLSGRYKKSVKLLERASDLGYLPANQRLAWYYGNGVYKSFPADRPKAFYYMQRSAKAGDSTAMLYIASCYVEGYGTPKDVQMGIALYEKVAGMGNVTAMNRLAETYKGNSDVPANAAKAAEWTTRAANGGDLESLRKIYLEKKDCEGLARLANKYEHGEGVPQSSDKFYGISSDGSRIGCGQCSYNMYYIYDHRVDGEEMAMMYLKLAQKQGYNVKTEEIAAVQADIDRNAKKPYQGYINSNARTNNTTNNTSPSTQGSQQKCPYCNGAGQVKVEGVKSSYTDSYGHKHSTYEALHWNKCSYCNGTGYISK